MRQTIPKILFDQEDYELLYIVNEVFSKDKTLRHFKKLFGPYLHPHGIKEIAQPKELRIAYAVIQLLDSLDADKMKERLSALRSLRDEVLYSAESSLHKNTARVLLQIMKEVVRAHGNYRRQLELAHDFRKAAAGKPRMIRQLLRRHHLLEMPEEWSQITFDDHVHDAHTKGRKSPSHLIMDAWIKGIRALTVIYYNYVEPGAAAELLEAAQIMGITVRIGIELSVRFRNKYVQLIYVPHGGSDVQDFLSFLTNPSVREFMNEGRKVSKYQQSYVMMVLREFNKTHLHALNETFGLKLGPIDQAEFLSFVGTGQPSLLHLSELIHTRLLPAMRTRVAELRGQYTKATPSEREQITHLVNELNKLDSKAIFEYYLSADKNPTLPNPNIPQDAPDVPEMLTYSPRALIKRLNQFSSWYSMTLNLSDLQVEDVLELLYNCKGWITHLEIFNLKDYAAGKISHHAAINELQRAINAGNVIKLKRIIREMIQHIEISDSPDKSERIKKLTEILRNIAKLRAFYKDSPLKAYIGSDSVGRATHLQHGMGLAIKKTLPHKVQREFRNSIAFSRQIIPVRTEAYLHSTYIPYENAGTFMVAVYRLIEAIPGLRLIAYKRHEAWVVQEQSTRLERNGNIVTLGGIQDEIDNGLYLEPPKSEENQERISWTYLNSGLKNGLKVLIGFVPAFATFALTKDWWLLTYFGAFIWFGITGLRNIFQSVLGGGGIRRSPLLNWKDYMNWDRFADSLLFTGFSVPLLDYVVKTLILQHLLDITTATNPNALYAFMALVNGLYLSSHNILRGLPRGAVIGNFFRSILSIPLAIIFNAVIGGILNVYAVPGIPDILQKWAAIISKTASDCVAGIIEGIADRYRNINIRKRDYEGKISQLLETYARLELLFPESDVSDLLKSPKKLIRSLNAEARDLEQIMIINALDLLYFWMYQPRARNVLRTLLRAMSPEEVQIITRSQYILKRQRDISKMFIDGILGKKFSKALALYLDRSEEYINAMHKLAEASIPQDTATDTQS